jgi:hypothetical protein
MVQLVQPIRMQEFVAVLRRSLSNPDTTYFVSFMLDARALSVKLRQLFHWHIFIISIGDRCG